MHTGLKLAPRVLASFVICQEFWRKGYLRSVGVETFGWHAKWERNKLISTYPEKC